MTSSGLAFIVSYRSVVTDFTCLLHAMFLENLVFGFKYIISRFNLRIPATDIPLRM